jgi:hypothetical protein
MSSGHLHIQKDLYNLNYLEYIVSKCMERWEICKYWQIYNAYKYTCIQTYAQIHIYDYLHTYTNTSKKEQSRRHYTTRI